MSDLTKAAENAARLSELFAGIVALGPALSELGSLDQALAERKRKVTDYDKLMLGAQAEHDRQANALRDQLAIIKGDIRNRTEDLKQATDKVRQEKFKAEVEAKAIVQAAKADADAIVKQAEGEAKSVKDDADRRVATVNANLAAKALEYEERRKDIIAANDELARIKGEIAALRARLTV